MKRVQTKKFICRKEGCDKAYVSRSGRLYHEAHHKKYDVELVQKPEENITPISIDVEKNNSIKIKEVNFIMAKKKLSKEESEEKEFECGECGAEFDTKTKYCPECGIKFGA